MLFKHRLRISLFLLILLGLLIPNNIQALSSPSITILTPGEDSETTTPITLRAELHPGADNLVRITLIDQNDNLLARKLLRLSPGAGDVPILLETDLAFEIPTDGTAALLTVSTQDEYHRPQALRSVILTLKSEGPAIIQSHNSSEPWLVIDEPAPLTTLGGGQITVSGMITPVNDDPVRFELLKVTGAVIGSTQLQVTDPGKATDFEVVLPYAFVTTTTDIRLIIRQISKDFASDEILDSIPLLLTP